ncbi:MAG: LysR family transcriptional regulator [Steroidobacteraceae bacterium]
MPQMQPALLRLFVAVAESGSISRVAIEHGKAQSYVSRQISRFERECGAALFHRTGRGVVLTELGEQILPRVRAWLVATDELSNEIKSSSGVIVGTVRVGVLPSTAHPIATTLFQRTRDLYPGIKLQIVEGGPQLDTWVNSGKIDIAVLFRYNDKLARNETALATTDTYLVAKVGDPVTRKKTVEFTKLAGLPLALPQRQSDLRDTLEAIARQKKINLSVVVEANSLSFQRGVVLEGLCHTLLGPFSFARDVQAGRLQAAQIVQPRIRRIVTLVVTEHGPLTVACKTVIKLIEEIFAEVGDNWMPLIE